MNLFALYTATLIMRAAAFAGVAVMQHVLFPDPKDAFWKGLLFTVYPLAEVVSVGYYGARCDRVGRKRILVFAHAVTAVAVFLFLPSIGFGTPGMWAPYLVAVMFVLFGFGAAAKVSSTLTMVNDLCRPSNRAQRMAIFDIVTLGGFAGGFGLGFLALTNWRVSPDAVLLVAGVGVLVSLALVLAAVRETPFTPEPERGTWDLLRAVVRDPDILRLLPVYIPVLALYGYAISFADRLFIARSGPPVSAVTQVVVVGALAGPLVLSMLLASRWSDVRRLRKPFMAVGLVGFGGLAVLLSLAEQSGGGVNAAQLASRWPWIALTALGAGAFPPAALAYLGDIARKDVSGTTFGLYSIVFGSGLIVGPILGGTLTVLLGAAAFLVIALGLIGVSTAGLLLLREPGGRPRVASG